VIELFIKFVHDMDSVVIRTYTKQELEDILYDFLLKQDELLASAESALTGVSTVSTSKSFSSESEYISARFLKHLADTRDDMFAFFE
jgi:hypothetical protein